MLTFDYDAHKNKNNDKRVISIAQLCLSAVLNIPAHLPTKARQFLHGQLYFGVTYTHVY